MVNVTIWTRTRANIQRVAALEQRSFVGALDRLVDLYVNSSAAAAPTTQQQESNGSPESVLTADPPTEKPVSNMKTQDEASTKIPPAGQPETDCNPDQAVA